MKVLFSKLILPSLVLNYLIFNLWLINNKNSEVENIDNWLAATSPIWIKYLFLNFIIFIFLVASKENIKFESYYLILIFLIFQAYNLNQIPEDYFWKTVPDTYTYKQLGQTFFDCGKLALSCSEQSILNWPFGQPIFSYILFNYFYSLAKYIYLFLFTFSVYLFVKFLKTYFSEFAIFLSLVYFLLLPNNYEITSFILSEIPYIFFTILGLHNLKKPNYEISFLFFVLSFLFRPIGVINLFIFFILLILRKVKVLKYIFVFSIFIFSYMTYNYIFNGNFVYSTVVSTNVQGDGIIESTNVLDYSVKLITKDTSTKLWMNINRLYGEGSRACVFDYCFIYNPLYEKSGQIPQLLTQNTLFGRVSLVITKLIFEIGSPLGVWTYIPLLIIFSFKKNVLLNVVNFIFISNILLSILTTEYGSRWWLLPNILLIYIISNFINLLTSSFKKIFKNQIK